MSQSLIGYPDRGPVATSRLDINKVNVSNSATGFDHIHATLKVNNKFYCGSTSTFGIFVFTSPDTSLAAKTQIRSGSTGTAQFAYDSVNNKIYCNSAAGNSITEIDPTTDTFVDHPVTGLVSGQLPGVATDGTFVYVISYTNPTILYKIAIATWTISAQLTLPNGAFNGHAAQVIQYSDGIELIVTCVSGNLFKIDPVALTVLNTFNTLSAFTYIGTPTDDFAYVKAAANTTTAGSIIWIAGETGGALRFQSGKDSFSGASQFSNQGSFTTALPTFGLFTDGTLIYNVASGGYIQTWNATDNNPATQSAKSYYCGNTNAPFHPNELLISDGGKLFFTDWDTVGGIYQFTLHAPTSNYYSILDIITTNNLITTAINNFKSSGGLVQDVGSLANLIARKNNNALFQGFFYKCDQIHPSLSTNSRGSYSIIPLFQAAFQPNQILLQGYARFFVPNYASIPVWNPAGSYAANAKVAYGGFVWTNVAGAVGTALDHYTLSTAWNFSVPTINNTDYVSQWDAIVYDINNDQIVERREGFSGNIVRFTKADADYFTSIGITGNAIKDFQWGRNYVLSTNIGVGDVTIDHGYMDCVNFMGPSIFNVQVKPKAYIQLGSGTSARQLDILVEEGAALKNGTLNATQSNILIRRNATWDRGAATISVNEGPLVYGKLNTAASITANAGFNIPTGVAPTTPVDGDIWQDGTNFKTQVGGVVKTFTLI
jgi:hypothetical protein